MITEDSHSSVAVIIKLLFRVNCVLKGVDITFVKLSLKCIRGIIGTENLSRETLHIFFKIVVQLSCVDLVENVVRWFFGFTELQHVLSHVRSHLDSVKVSHRVFTQEIKCNFITFTYFDVLYAERAAADRVSFIITLLITNTKSEFINQISADSELVEGSVIRLHRFFIIGTNFINAVL
jgi:hypothetical protein